MLYLEFNWILHFNLLVMNGGSSSNDIQGQEILSLAVPPPWNFLFSIFDIVIMVYLKCYHFPEIS